jgi:hypothetical protein
VWRATYGGLAETTSLKAIHFSYLLSTENDPPILPFFSHAPRVSKSDQTFSDNSFLCQGTCWWEVYQVEVKFLVVLGFG